MLPVINEKAVEFTVMTGAGAELHDPAFAKFDRKNYPYPDLLKGYQISQYDLPLTEARLARRRRSRARSRGASASRAVTSKRTRRG